jgi:cytochrome c oxidase subunit 3
MVLVVDAGHHMKKTKVAIYMLLTIVGGFIFLGSQAWEWKNLLAVNLVLLKLKVVLYCSL